MDRHRSNKTANTRAGAGLSRQFQMSRTFHFKDPKKAGSHGYPLWFRIRVIEHVYAHGINDAHHNWMVSKKSIRR